MKLTTKLRDMDGNEFADGATLKAVIINALLTPLHGDDKKSGTDKMKLFRLAQKVHDGDDLTLPAEDVALIKERTGLAYAPLIVGRIWEAIDPAVGADEGRG